MNSIEVIRNGGKDCEKGGHSQLFWGMFLMYLLARGQSWELAKSAIGRIMIF